MNRRFRSLQVRMLLPILSVAIIAALGVAFFSYWLGDRRAQRQISARYRSIALSLNEASFPLNRQVVRLLADLTDTELITLTEDGSVINSSFDVDRKAPLTEILDAPPSTDAAPDRMITLRNQSYRFAVFDRKGYGADDARRVAVLFDEDKLRQVRLPAAGWPLATGLSTIFLLASVTLYLAGRLVARLTRLQRDVNLIAEGNFDATIQVGTEDEVALLGTAVKEMSSQLKQMWQTLHSQESEKLLHQIAGGLAHQLRNSIAGARMAVELHSTRCQTPDDEALPMAVSQLEQTDDYVRRLLLVAAGKQDEDRPGSAGQCLNDLRSNMTATANHLNVRLDWVIDEAIHRRDVADAPSLAAALTNLILNAMQAGGNDVQVCVSVIEQDRLRIDVSDNGPGLSDSIDGDVFDPFVSTKPEGLGLGLPLVKRSAERLGGRVEWSRQNGRTHFVMHVTTIDRADQPSQTDATR